MADTKLGSLPVETTFAVSDYLVKVKAAGGGDVLVTLQNLLNAIGGKNSVPYKFSYSGSALTTSNSQALVKFPTSIFDTGSNYSASTGLFTAPVAGFYWFNLDVWIGVSNSGVNGAQTWLSKNANASFRQISFTNSSANTGTNLYCGGGALLQLAANDTVGVYALDTFSTGMTGVFEGFIVSAT